MADAPRPPQVPPSLDRAAVERVLARATQLQGADPHDSEGRLSEAQLESLAKEVGLDPINLRQALAEERTRIATTSETGMMAGMFGSAGVAAQRTVTGTPSQVLKALDDWMQRQESLVPQRYFNERVVWESRRDIVGVMRRAVSGRGQALSRATTVGATAVAIDTQRVLVRLDADLGGHRSLMANQNIAMGGMGVAAGAVLAVMGFAPLAVVAPFALLTPGAYAIARSAHRGATASAQLALEQVLDRLERGEAGRPPSLISMLAAAVGGRKL